ncbi:hypothetical protein A3F55_01755 [Candidatus Adlerbacteria bacterium RIFCSPHIGHO2_12_FULL_53_18]|uniref:Uncharacterized protein n=1 Tax=Candidatus Adlerbacteria bacterium RIFCSPHIGHO2_12_FULL_53_18 TaxID=1797242 RepID=A0A1F4XTV1_9BACT|nr:MAG: hypothetical protein A3F55_01755 [Candidatus Adlerbacteria bacterium RIFCSPHIGHO2_12_FULL_53_18]
MLVSWWKVTWEDNLMHEMKMGPDGHSDYEHEEHITLLYRIGSWIGFLFLLPMLIAGVKMNLLERRRPQRQ